MSLKVEFHIEKVTKWNAYPGSFTKLEPRSRYEIITEITRKRFFFFYSKERTHFKDLFPHYDSFLPQDFETEKQARSVVEELLMKGKFPGMTTRTDVPPSYTFKNLK